MAVVAAVVVVVVVVVVGKVAGWREGVKEWRTNG